MTSRSPTSPLLPQPRGGRPHRRRRHGLLTARASFISTAAPAAYSAPPGQASQLIDIYELGEIPIAAARVLLSAVQQAAIYAAAGTERADRLLDEPNPEEPLPPLCARCAEGQVVGERNPDPHHGCGHDGHAPCGHKNSSGAWQRAKTSYAEHRADVDQLRRLPRRHRQ